MKKVESQREGPQRTLLGRALFAFALCSVLASIGLTHVRPIDRYYYRANGNRPVRTISAVEPGYTKMAIVGLSVVAVAVCCGAASIVVATIRVRPEGLLLAMPYAYLLFTLYIAFLAISHYLGQHGILMYGV